MRTTCPGAAILAIALAGSGCGGEATSTTQASKNASASTTAPAPEPAAAPRRPAARKDAALAVRDAQIDSDLVRLELLELHRSGVTSTLTLRLSTTQEDARAQITDTFADGVSTDAEGYPGSNSLDGISLIDGKNRKRYLVARDSRGICVCDNDLGGAFVKPRAPIILSATFAAPPADIGAIDVAVPRFGTFRDVPLS